MPPQPSIPGRILGLDVGDRRVGIALSDPLGTIAQPLLTLGRTHRNKELRDIGRLLQKYEVTEIVAGIPLLASGEESSQTRKTTEFAQAIADKFGMPVHLQPESLTSRAAEELLDRRGVPRGPERKAVLDQYAAVVILQDWLDEQALRSGKPLPEV